jgi:hypothetical protein
VDDLVIADLIVRAAFVAIDEVTRPPPPSWFVIVVVRSEQSAEQFDRP